jgi:dihydrofolate reductase
MGRLVVSEFMTLDGVMEAPGHDEHRDGKNTWALQATTEEQQQFKVDELFSAGAILFGRVTYQIWAAFWPDAPKDEGFADRITASRNASCPRPCESPRGTTRRSSGVTSHARSPG